MTTEFRAGTSGYSYKEWRGSFYPEGLSADAWLGYYAERLPAVEINNTFYRMPRSHVVEQWRDSVPDTFRFVIKASRRITHQLRLRGAEEPLGYLLARAETLGEKLGALLFQLPPYMRLDLDRLTAFQAELPESLPVAFEFRHESWSVPEVDEALRVCGHARVVTHDEGDPPEPLLENPLAYLRLRAPSYSAAQLRGWRDRVTDSGAERAFVFFKHEDAGAGPKLADRFMKLVGRAAPKAAGRRGASRTGAPAKAPRRRKSSTQSGSRS